MSDIRVMSLWQPYATLLADPDLPKTIETRPKPWPSTIPLDRGGAWVLVHAAAKRPKETILGSYYTHDTAGMFLVDRGFPLDRRPLPLGAVIGAAHVVASLPIVDGECLDHCIHFEDWTLRGYSREGCPYPFLAKFQGDWDGTAIDEELPYGDFTPGRYGYLTDRTVLFPEPIPWRGAQGWQRATPDLIAAAVAQAPEIGEP